jgi:hypothetical protein
MNMLGFVPQPNVRGNSLYANEMMRFVPQRILRVDYKFSFLINLIVFDFS